MLPSDFKLGPWSFKNDQNQFFKNSVTKTIYGIAFAQNFLKQWWKGV